MRFANIKSTNNRNNFAGSRFTDSKRQWGELADNLQVTHFLSSLRNIAQQEMKVFAFTKVSFKNVLL